MSVPDVGTPAPDGTETAVPTGGVRVPDAGITVPEVTLEPAGPEAGSEPELGSDAGSEPELGSEATGARGSGVPAPPETGDPRVDTAVAPLGDLGDAPTEEHVGAYEDAHSGLQEALADLDRDQPDQPDAGGR